MPAHIQPWGLLSDVAPLLAAPAAIALAFAANALLRVSRRPRRRPVRLKVVPYRGDTASAEAVVAMFEALHKRLVRRWWRRLIGGQPSLSLEIHCDREAWLAVTCPASMQTMVESALRAAYPSCRLERAPWQIGFPPAVLRLKKREEFIKRAKTLDRFEHDREPAVNRLLTTMGACGGPVFVQLALTPAPASFERHAKRLYKRHEARLSRERGEGLIMPRRDRSLVEESELKGGLDIQHRPLFFTDLRVIASNRQTCERIASELRSGTAENRLIERGTTLRHGLLGLYGGRVQRGEGNPLPSTRRGVFASTELAALWHLPSIDYLTVPFERSSVPLAPAPPGILRPGAGRGTLRDAFGPISIHPQMRRQNTAVPGTVEQGKSSYLVATVAEDLRRPRCCVIVLDPKGDAADAAVSLVPRERTCTLLDLSHPTCGFNPLAVDAPADVIADYVVAAMRNLFDADDIKASSDRYLRNAIIAVLAYDRSSTLWDAARLLSVGEEGYAYRARVGARVRELPELKEISEFFTAELSAQLSDARSTTTAKLDAPVNKLARLLNSPSIKRVLLNDSLMVDFDRVIAGAEVLVVKGALGAMGAGNTSVLMQLLIGMLDAALARQQDLVEEERRVSVALKVDEAPIVLNRGFAETMALKRSAGLETVACWQTDAQWTEREVRDQLDALFAHRVYFATASVEDARSSARLTMAQFSDTVRPRIESLSVLGHPDARLHLPKHHAIATWTTPEGRQAPFVAQTIPMRTDPERIAWHATRQTERGGSYREDLSQPHWDSPDRMRPTTCSGRPGADPDGPARRSQADERRTVADSDGAVQLPQAEGGQPAGAPDGRIPPTRSAGRMPTLPETPAQSYRELVELDGAQSVRTASRGEALRRVEVDDRDLAVIAMVAGLGHVLSSQLHRRLDAGRAVTTTQRRLKRLADAGLLERFQLHRQDGGGVPMCCSVSPAGLKLLADRDLVPWEQGRGVQPPTPSPLAGGASALRAVRREVHAAAWALAFERAAGAGPLEVIGAHGAVLCPPVRSTPQGPAALGPADLRLPGGRAPHGFQPAGGTPRPDSEIRFETIRPHVRIDWPGGSELDRREGGLDLLVELDDRIGSAAWTAKLRRYDHFLSGWCAHTRRYRNRTAIAVFVCRDRARARECARRADAVLLACRAYAGEYPADWEYVGRERVVFVAERDVHEGVLAGYGVNRLPPELRDGAGREPDVETCMLVRPA